MAEANQHRLTRKDLRQPDEFQALTSQGMDWLRNNQAVVVGAVSAVIAIGAVVMGVSWYSQRQADGAAVRLQSAQALFDAKTYANAATEFAAVADSYPRTPAGRIAVLYRAHALAQQPDPGAADAYSEYLATTPATDYLRQEALLGLARANEAAGKTPEATTAYRQAADVAGPFRTPARLALARLEDAAGHADQARALYAEALKAPDLDADTRQLITSKLPPGTLNPETTPGSQ